MKYFVTGATGFIGGHVTRQLVAAGHQVIALARDPRRATDLTSLGVSVHGGDVTDKASMREPMQGVDGVFHIAAWYKIGARDMRPAWRINVDGTRNVLELVAELSVPRAVYTSTLAVFSDTHGRVVDESYRYDGPHISEYDRTKWVAHYQIAEPAKASGLPLVVVQPGLTYGPGDASLVQQTFVQYLRRRLLVAPRRTAYCWAHVEDTARGHILAMEKGLPGQSYIIAGDPHTFLEAMDLAQAITGIAGPRIHLDPAAMRSIGAILGVVERVVPLPELYSAEAIRSTAGVTYLGSNRKASAELGFRVRPWEDGLRETLFYEMDRLGLRRGTPGA